jgi:hypothetical protein
MHQFYHSKLHISFSNTWISHAQRRELHHQDKDQEIRKLRNEEDFYVPFLRLCSIDRHPLVNYLKLWNELSHPEIKSTAHKLVFNKQLKKHFLDKLDSNYKCTRLLCPHCHL